MSGAKLVNGVLSSGVSALLRTHGFVRKSLVFRRKVGAAENVIQVQISRGSHATEAEFVLNLGTYHPSVERLLHEKVVTDPSEPACTVRERMGPKVRGNDPWWTLMPGEEAGIGAMLSTSIEDRVLPWLALTSDLSKLSLALKEGKSKRLWAPNSLADAAIALAIGKKPLAKTLIKKTVADIEATLDERRAHFGAKDPFGSAVLKLAARMRKEHGL